MTNIYFYFHAVFMVFLIAVTSYAIYSGLFKANRLQQSSRKTLCAVISATVASGFWGVLGSWSYLGW